MESKQNNTLSITKNWIASIISGIRNPLVFVMVDYQAMYPVLFQSITAAIEQLQHAQQQTEELYISSDQVNVTVLNQEYTEAPEAELH